ncbi:MAG: hypothetical protein HY907_04025 [Deltaproteobacteria bacterium]|nr:hypothetical protein [Deltaproteobacteria bacterium]
MSPMRVSLPSLLLLLLAPSCTEQGTEILLTIRTDLPVPQRADRVALHVTAESDSPEVANFEQDYEYPLGAGEGQYGMPVQVSVRPGTHYSGRVVFNAELRLGPERIIAGDTEVRFRSGESVQAEILLPAADAQACPGDPADGTIGLPCAACPTAEGYQCIPPIEQSFDGEEYVSWADGYCFQAEAFTRNCSLVADNCPEGARCMPYGRGLDGLPRYICFDECNPLDERGEPWDVNCDCRDGYACEIGAGICLPGCSNDRECCETWEDLDADGQRGDGEVAPVPGCVGHCDRATFRCVYESGAGDYWASCTHPSQCADGTACLQLDQATLSGYCTVVGCEVPALGTACEDHGGWCLESTYSQCLKRCDPRVPLADSGCPERTACHDFGDDTDGNPIGGCYYVCGAAAQCGGFRCDPVSQGCVWE